MLGRLTQGADFERALAVTPRARSAHFALHHLPQRPARPARVRRAQGAAAHLHVTPPAVGNELSTDRADTVHDPVDNRPPLDAGECWLGSVVPKRHARRAVTRNLVKRQIREAMRRHVAGLPGGLYVIRLRQGFDARHFPSAASDALRQAARDELERMLRTAGRR